VYLVTSEITTNVINSVHPCLSICHRLMHVLLVRRCCQHFAASSIQTLVKTLCHAAL
jgi:hypothetical protein